MIVVFGSINVDLIARIARIPAPGETLSGSSFVTAPGGKGANQALAARRAGANVALYGAVGHDSFAASALANLDASGVRREGVATVAASTGIALINVADSGENAIAVIPGTNALACAAQVPDNVLTPATTLLLQLEVPHVEVERLAQRAHERGARVILNAAPAAALAHALLRSLDVLLVNEHEGAMLAAELRVAREPVSRLPTPCAHDSPRRGDHAGRAWCADDRGRAMPISDVTFRRPPDPMRLRSPYITRCCIAVAALFLALGLARPAAADRDSWRVLHQPAKADTARRATRAA